LGIFLGEISLVAAVLVMLDCLFVLLMITMALILRLVIEVIPRNQSSEWRRGR
jgi:hypothetical protein